jgi:hypothetical protein
MSTECLWPLDPGCLTDEWAAMTPEIQARAQALATASLRRLSGYRVGGCPIEVRPCVQSCASSLAWARPQSPWMRGWGPSQLADGSWVNSCACSAGDCSCTALCEVVLSAPVGQVTWVKVDGIELATTDYRVDGSHLLWIGVGDCPWPACQDMTADSDQVGTFAVSYLNAHAPDALAAYAAGVLAMEFAKACVGGKCRLPATVTSVARQGVVFEIAAGTFPDGTTGIREVDAWIGLWRPPGSPNRTATVWSPNQRVPRVVG